MNADTDRMHERTMVIDGHADIEIEGRESPYVGADGKSKVAPEKLLAGQVDAIVLSIAASPGPRTAEGYAAARRAADRKQKAVMDMIADDGNPTALATTAEDADRLKANGNIAIYLGFQNTQIIGREVDALEQFYANGVRVFALNHIGHNECSDSSRPNYIASKKAHESTEEHGGLSALGQQAIQLINRMGGVVDISQMSKNATLQTLDLTTAPVIASHSNVRALCDLSRNLSDQEIDAIGNNGGVIHVCPFRGYLFDTNDVDLVQNIREARLAANLPEEYLYPFELYWEIEDAEEKLAFRQTISDLLGPGSMDTLMDHVDYLAERIGVDHIGIGSDFNHGGGIGPFNEAHDAPNVTRALVERGYSETDIDKIWGRNFLRVMQHAHEAVH